jgi:hypothetical protein
MYYGTSKVKTGKFKYPITNQHGTVWRDKPFIHKPLSTTQQKLADTIKKEIGRSLTQPELTRIRKNQVTKVSEFRSFIPADIWKETTDKIKKLRLKKVNINLSDEAFAKKLNDVYKIKTRSRKPWTNMSVGELQKSLKISDTVGAKATRSLDEIKKIVGTLKKGEQILKDFDAGKISETQLRSKASHKVHQTKPETKIRLKKWMKENPEIVRAMEEKKQMRGWSRSSFPRMGKNAKSNIWANLHENVRKERGRIELIDDNVIYEKDGTINWKRAGKNGKPNWQNVKFKDKVKNAIFTWDNLEKKVDNVFGKNAYKRFAFPYEARNQLTEATITYKGKERSVGSVLNEGLLKKHYKKYAKSGETFDAFKARKAKGFGVFEANHMYANDPWQTQLTFRDSNRVLSNLDDTFQKELRVAVDDPKKTKQLTKNFINKVKALPGGIEWNIGDQMIGKKPSIGSVTQAAFGETGLSRTFEANPQLKNLIKAIGCPDLAAGGRVGFQTGTTCLTKGVEAINSGKFAKGAQSRNAAKFLNAAMNVGNKVYKGVRWISKYGVVPEMVFIGAESLIRMGMGDTLDESLKSATSYLPGGTKREGEAQLSKLSRRVGSENAKIILNARNYQEKQNYVSSLEKQRDADLALAGTDFDEMSLGESSAEINKRYDALIKDAKADAIMSSVSEAEARTAKNLEDEALDIRKTEGVTSRLQLLANEIGEVDDISGLSSDAQAPAKIRETLPSLRYQHRNFGFDDKESFERFKNMDEKTIRGLAIDYPEAEIEDIFQTQDIAKKMDPKNLSLGELAEIYGDEQIYGASGNFGRYIHDPVRDGLRKIAIAGGVSKLANGGIASLTRTTQPESGPQHRGLDYLRKHGRGY